MDSINDTDLYPHIEPYDTGLLALGDGHVMYYEQSGNPSGVPALFLHGGPGSGTVAAQRRFFDPEVYRIVLFDQRGAGRSTPSAGVEHNTTQHLVGDIERLREHLGIRQWLVFGGSWGATLALAYGQANPEKCLGFVLRGVFLGEAAEIDWFLDGAARVFPEEHAAFVAASGRGGDSLLEAFERRLFSPDPAVHLPAARAWARYENACSTLLPPRIQPGGESFDAFALAISRIEAHYFLNAMFLEPGQLLASMDMIRHLPATIVQGRYDMVCPPQAAIRLAGAWPGAALELVPDAGHSPFEPGIRRALVRATDAMRGVLMKAF